MHLAPQRCDVEQIRKTISVFMRPTWLRGDVAEFRALGTQRGIVSGLFDAEHEEQLFQTAVSWSGEAEGCYFMPNPCRYDILARAANRFRTYCKHVTKDDEITRRHWLLIDTDPRRPSGISSTDDEHERALDRARDIREWLTTRAFPLPVLADSGNGGHLAYRVDLPPSDGGHFKTLLQNLSDKFSDDKVHLDSSVFNAARIWKFYGTLAAKGDSIPSRPHRLSRILEVPVPLEVIQ
jgi:hypothetical protein